MLALFGTLAYVAVLGGMTAATVHAARRLGILTPVVVGFALRVVVLVVAHALSESSGAHGFFYLDDQGYDSRGEQLANAWGSGTVPDLIGLTGTQAYGYPVLVGAVYELAGHSLLAGKALNLVLSTATIVAAACLAGRLIDGRARTRTAWLAALVPTLIWWAAPLLKEAVAAFLVTVAMLAATYLPRPRAAVGYVLLLAALLLVRSSAALAVAGTVVLAASFMWLRARSETAAVRVAVSVAAVGAALLLAGHGDVGLVPGYFRSANELRTVYQGGGGKKVTETHGVTRQLPAPLDMARTLVAPYPWVFDKADYGWGYRALFPGMWVWYLLLPTAALGAWTVWRRPELLPAALLPFLMLLGFALTSGSAIRQRSSMEPVLLVLVAAGIGSWRRTGALGAGALALVAPIAAVHSGSVAVGAAILAAATALALLSRRLPSESELRTEAGEERLVAAGGAG